MQNGESPEAVSEAMAPPPPVPVATPECKASGTLAVGAGFSANVAVNEKTGVSKWASFQTSTLAARAGLSCGVKFASTGKALPAAGGISLGLGILSIEITQTSTRPDVYIGIGPEIKSPLNPSINVPF